MVESFYSLRDCLESIDALNSISIDSEEDHHQRDYLSYNAEMKSRYAFLLAANSLESAANALLLSLKLSTNQYDEYERLPTLTKYELFCLYHNKRIDRISELYNDLKEIIKCRNEFVHPKPGKALIKDNSDNSNIEIVIKRTKANNYPLSFSLFEPKHTINAIKDILTFLSLIIFEICEYSIEEGSLLIGNGSRENTGSIIMIATEYNMDIRTFGYK